MNNHHFLSLFDSKGTLHGVMLSAELWQKGKHQLEPIIEALLGSPKTTELPEPLEDWQSFLQFWDFKYPVNTAVTCKACGATTDNWENDPSKPFRLKSAQLGGLVVFACKNCGATVRKKHFKDHMCFEVTPLAKKN